MFVFPAPCCRWVVLTAVWFLSAGLRMDPSALQRHAYLFHLAGWGAPAALTVGVLVLRDVTADQLTGQYIAHETRPAYLARG